MLTWQAKSMRLAPTLAIQVPRGNQPNLQKGGREGPSLAILVPRGSQLDSTLNQASPAAWPLLHSYRDACPQAEASCKIEQGHLAQS